MTMKSILGVCTVYMLFSVPTTIVFSSGGDASNNWNIGDNIVSNLGNGGWGVFIKVLMWASCVCSQPVLLSSTSELLEKNCPATKNTFFVCDRQRLLIRFLQIGALSFISYVLPFFGEVINLYILLCWVRCGELAGLNDTWRICIRCHFDFDSCGDSLLRIQVYDAKATGHHPCHFRRCCVPFDGHCYCVLDCETSGKHVEQVISFPVFLETNSSPSLGSTLRSSLFVHLLFQKRALLFGQMPLPSRVLLFAGFAGFGWLFVALRIRTLLAVVRRFHSLLSIAVHAVVPLASQLLFAFQLHKALLHVLQRRRFLSRRDLHRANRRVNLRAQVGATIQQHVRVFVHHFALSHRRHGRVIVLEPVILGVVFVLAVRVIVAKIRRAAVVHNADQSIVRLRRRCELASHGRKQKLGHIQIVERIFHIGVDFLLSEPRLAAHRILKSLQLDEEKWRESRQVGRGFECVGIVALLTSAIV